MAKNMRMDKNAMPEQPAEVRNKNFLEVALGYTAEQAMDEARRCLSCRNRPCVSGCPVGVDIPGFIAKVAAKTIRLLACQCRKASLLRMYPTSQTQQQ